MHLLDVSHDLAVFPQVGIGQFCQMRWQTAATWWRTYSKERLTCSGWAASPRREQDPSVKLQLPLSWQLILKARKSVMSAAEHVWSLFLCLLFYCQRTWFSDEADERFNMWKCWIHTEALFQFSFLLFHRDPHSSYSDWATWVKDPWNRRSDHKESLQLPVWDQQVSVFVLFESKLVLVSYIHALFMEGVLNQHVEQNQSQPVVHCILFLRYSFATLSSNL